MTNWFSSQYILPMQTLSDLGELAATIYFSSLSFIIIPVMGAAVGAVTAKVIRVNVGLGLLLGLASGLSGIGLAIITGYAYGYAYGGNGERWFFLLVVLALPPGGAFAPIAILPLLRLKTD